MTDNDLTDRLEDMFSDVSPEPETEGADAAASADAAVLREEESLISLNIIEEKSARGNIKLYGLTPFGKEIIESLRNKK